MFTPYIVAELAQRAEIYCVYVTSINDGAQILTFLGIDNNRDFRNALIAIDLKIEINSFQNLKQLNPRIVRMEHLEQLKNKRPGL